MSVYTEKEELRSIRIGRALSTAMFSLLRKKNFRKITVKDICEESLISRASFYFRFTDKYDFLKWWITAVWPDNVVDTEDIYEVNEQKINQLIDENKNIIKNIILDADSWTLDVLFDVLHPILHLTIEKTIDGAANPKYIVLSNFYIGGMIQYILWQSKNNFPTDVKTMNIYLREVMETFQRWS